MKKPLREPLGAGLRERREEKGVNLRALAGQIGVSPSLISQIERGKTTPSVATLFAIVSELGISLDELFFGNLPGAPALAATEAPVPDRPRPSGAHWRAPSEGPILRAPDRLRITPASGVRWELLTSFHDPEVEFLYCTYAVGGESCPADDLISHGGSEYGVILAGRCGATTGEESYELEPGDSIAFASRMPHRIWNLSEEDPMVAIWAVIGSSGDPRVG